MPLQQGLSGIREITVDNLILDAGILYYDIDEAPLQGSGGTPFADAVQNAGVFGATRGGQAFNLNRTNRQVDANGRRLPIKEFNRIDEMVPTLSVVLLEHDPDNMLAYFGAADKDAWTHYDQITPRLVIQEGDYFSNVALAATISGSNNPVFIVLRNALVVSNVEIPVEDRSEAAIASDFVGHSLPSAPLDVPVSVYVPNDLGS